jgi:hypothetical protein
MVGDFGRAPANLASGMFYSTLRDEACLLRASYCIYASACCNRSRKNVLSIRRLWLVAIPISGLAFGTFASILLENFNFMPKSDPTRRRSFSRERSNEPLSFAAKSKHLIMFTLKRCEAPPAPLFDFRSLFRAQGPRREGRPLD